MDGDRHRAAVLVTQDDMAAALPNLHETMIMKHGEDLSGGEDPRAGTHTAIRIVLIPTSCGTGNPFAKRSSM